MASENLDLQFLVDQKESKSEKTTGSLDEAHESVEKVVEVDPGQSLPDLNFLQQRDKANAPSASPKPPRVTEVKEEETLDPGKILQDLGVTQPVDFEPLQEAQTWSHEDTAGEVQHLQPSFDETGETDSESEFLSSGTETQDLQFDHVEGEIEQPLILEGEDSLFGEEEDAEESGPKVVEQKDLSFTLEDAQQLESLAEDTPHGKTKDSPFVEEPLVLPHEPEQVPSYDSLLAEQEETKTEPEEETLDLDLSALPSLEELNSVELEEQPAADPPEATEPPLDKASPEVGESLTEEPLILDTSDKHAPPAGNVPTSDFGDETKPGAAKSSTRPGSFAKKSSFSISSLFTTTQLVGVDIGATSVKYAVVKKVGRGFKLVNCGMRALPKEAVQEPDAKSDIVAGILAKEFKLKSYKDALITSAVSGLEVIFKNIKIPKVGEKELAKAVPWACRKDFPFPIESTIFQYNVVNEKDLKTDAKIKVYVTAAQKDLVQNHVKLIRKSEVLPAKVSTVPSALWNLFLTLDKKLTTGCYAMIDIGGKSSHIVFVNNGQLLFAREISAAGDDITQVLTGSIFVNGEEITISQEKAEGIKRKYGYLEKINVDSPADIIPLQEIAVLMNPALEKLAKEIQRTIDFFKEKFAIESLEKIFITGGTSLLKNLPAYLSKELNTEVDIFNPLDTISAKKFANQDDLYQLGPRLAVALGLAIDKNKKLNLLPREIRGVHASQYAKKMFRYVTVMAILAMIFLSQNVKRQLNRLETDFSRRKSDYEMTRPMREKFLSLQKRLSFLNGVKDNYHSVLDFDVNAAQHLKAISNVIPRNIALTSFQVTHREKKREESQKETIIDELVILAGVAFQNKSLEGINLAEFLLALEKSEYFYDIVLKSQKIREDGNLEFLLECTI